LVNLEAGVDKLKGCILKTVDNYDPLCQKYTFTVGTGLFDCTTCFTATNKNNLILKTVNGVPVHKCIV